jgi:multiple sugar transport system ATP-binding protein
MTMASRIAVMNLGVLQQVDTPLNLYERPDNLFVAGFIGSPSMNFFQAKVAKSDGKLVVDCGSFSADIPADRAGPYQAYVGKDVVFGIRPEDIHNPLFTPPGIVPSVVLGKVDVTEVMGNEIFAYMKNGPHAFAARVDPRSKFHMDDEVKLVFNMENMHIFDKETERAVR